MSNPVAPSSLGEPSSRPGAFCATCGSDRFRRSRLRTEDLLKVLELRWPVRCLHCNKRQYVSWLKALRAVSAKAPHASASPDQSWQSYTAGETPVLRDANHTGNQGKSDA